MVRRLGRAIKVRDTEGHYLLQCMVMQPADTVRPFLHWFRTFSNAQRPKQALTRMYNQPTERLPSGKMVGTLYKNPIDCLWKTLKTEGPLGWYKGPYL